MKRALESGDEPLALELLLEMWESSRAGSQ